MNTLTHDWATDSANPYSVPKSYPSLSAKSYLTFVICAGLVAASIYVGIWLHLQALQDKYERRVDTRYRGPYAISRAGPPVDY